MSKIADIQLKINNGKIELVARRENYIEISSSDLTLIQDEIKKIISFCESLKTDDEKLKEQKEKLLEFVLQKTTNEEKASNSELFDKWTINKAYRTNDYISHYGIVYKCLKEHVSSYENIPSITPENWEKIQKKEVEEGVNSEWQENFEKAENYSRDKTYMQGEYVKYYNELYKAKKKIASEQLPSKISEFWEHIPKNK